MTRKANMITCTEAGKLLGFSSDYIRRMCGDGRIVAEKYAGIWIMNEKALKDIRRKRGLQKKDVLDDRISERSVEVDSQID